jgi:hypothetical protein
LKPKQRKQADTLDEASALLRQENMDAFDWIGYFSDIIDGKNREKIQ